MNRTAKNEQLTAQGSIRKFTTVKGGVEKASTVKGGEGSRHERLAVKGLRSAPSAKRQEAALAPLTDEVIESGADLSAYFSNPRAVPAALEPQKVNVDFPAWVVAALDRESDRIGVPRQSLIKLWIVERLERPAAQSA